MVDKKLIGEIAEISLIVGGLNWGLSFFFNLNVVNWVKGIPYAQEIVYGVIGLSAVYIGWMKWGK